MNGDAFDGLTRALRFGTTRRRWITLLSGGAAGGALAAVRRQARALPACEQCTEACDRCEACLEDGILYPACTACRLCAYCAPASCWDGPDDGGAPCCEILPTDDCRVCGVVDPFPETTDAG